MTPLGLRDECVASTRSGSGTRLRQALGPGDIVADRYRIERTIGVGGNGAILRAVHLGLDLPVAIKVLLVDACPADELAHSSARFAREARTTAGLRHRNILSVHDAGALGDGSPYLVMELIEGEDLAQRIARAPLSIPAIVDFGRQLFSGLTALADADVLHRDVKPANLMLKREADGQVILKLVDFGIARATVAEPRLTVTGVIVGTPHYMPPEQLRGEELDVRSDLYAGCAVLYEATTGQPPFDGPSAPLVIGQILGGHLVPIRTLRPECPEALASLIERGLSRDRDARPAHPLDIVSALEQIVRSAGLPTGALAWDGEIAPDGTPAHPRVATPTRGARACSAAQELDGKPVAAGTTRTAPRSALADDAARRALSRAAVARAAIAIAAVVALSAGVVAARSTALASTDVAVAVAESALAAVPAPTEVAATVAVPVLPATPAPTERVDALLDRALEALAHGEVDTALAHYREAALADPARPEATRGRGLAAARAGLDDEAISALERYLALAPDAPDAERVRDRLEVTRAHRRVGSYPVTSDR